MPAAEHAPLLELAMATAREAAELITRRRTEGVAVAETKSSPVDVVTAADRECELLVRERLLGARPDDGFVGEEGEDVLGSSGVRWIVDPIDGTVNYLYGAVDHCVSIAAAVGDQVVVGVVLAPRLGAEYAAALGGGATRNGERLTVREPPLEGQALVATGFGYRREVRERQGRAVAHLLPRVRDVRRRGSCALDLCGVGAGELDGYVEEGPHSWDHSAGGLVATEAGATLEIWPSPSGADLVVAAPAAYFATFAELVRTSGFSTPEGP